MEARRLRVSGTVQGVGFRPFVARLAHAHGLSGWVMNGPHGVEIHLEGPLRSIDAFDIALETQAPPAACIDAIDRADVLADGLDGFRICRSERGEPPTARISPDLVVCPDCLREMLDPDARRFGYPYINCTNCGPRFSIIRGLPYDRERTTMAAWLMCEACACEYGNARDRRFHAEPVACPRCGPHYRLLEGEQEPAQHDQAIARAGLLLRQGALVAIKGIGGYHLACDAKNAAAVDDLRVRKFRKSKPFALMARDLETARGLVRLDAEGEALLTSAARPIVLAQARASLDCVAPNHHELGVMLPYAPIHHLLFAAGAPDVLVMTSANRASEPIAFEDADARERLAGIADAFLVGGREIARRVDDSIARSAPGGPVILRRGRGYAPGIVCRLASSQSILAVGADLKNTVTLAVQGDVFTSQHIGDLEHLAAYEAFESVIHDLMAMYEVRWDAVRIVHDLHPHYASTAFAVALPVSRRTAVQHHRAHVASVLAERAALDRRVVGVAFDGAGYGDDGTIWGGEFFVGSVAEGLTRAASLRPYSLPGGDAAARYPVQAAAGFLLDANHLADLTAAPFFFPPRYTQATRVARSGLRTFTTTSAGRLFDTAAALLGFTEAIEHEGQAAVWLEHLAWGAVPCEPLPFTIDESRIDMGPALHAMIERRLSGQDERQLARAFHESLAAAIVLMSERLCDAHQVDTIVLSGGTFQNALLLHHVRARLAPSLHLWSNRRVPPNDGGISLGQAALGAAEAGA